jgi:ATP-dependent exoDNAse (exonuclease V) beta subunit
MTIHKAKGLGFPVAIVLMYEEFGRGFKYIIDEETDGVHLLRINREIMKASSFLQEKYEEERLKDLVNKLNTLYVGFTRAEEELYIVGVQGRRNQFPIDLLNEMNSQTGRKSVPRPRSPETAQKRMELYHPPDPIRFLSAAIEKLNLEERMRGEFIHRVLYFVEGVDENIEPELERIIKRVNEEFMTDYSVETTKKDLLEFLNHGEINPFFQPMPGKVVKREQEFSDSRGNLFRMDRVVFEEDRVSVIDFKTGTEREAEKEYISQLKNYTRILKEIYPDRNIEGVIAYVDLKEIRKVKSDGGLNQ